MIIKLGKMGLEPMTVNILTDLQSVTLTNSVTFPYYYAIKLLKNTIKTNLTFFNGILSLLVSNNSLYSAIKGFNFFPLPEPIPPVKLKSSFIFTKFFKIHTFINCSIFTKKKSRILN